MMYQGWLSWWPVFPLAAAVVLVWWRAVRAFRLLRAELKVKSGLKCRKCGTLIRGGTGVYCQHCGSRQKRPSCKPGKHRWILLTKIQMAPGAARWCTSCDAAQLIVDAGDQTVGWRFLPVANVVASAKLLDLDLARGLGLIK